ncbi:MAG: thymidine kinase [Phycisphaerae bacterium]
MNTTTLKGHLTVVHGSMFAGKTEHTIALLRRESDAGKRVIAIKHSIDDRYDADHLVTHRGDKFEALRARNADEIEALVDGADLVAIDEGHFFKELLIPIVDRLRSRGIHVLVAGITHDAWGRPFEPMPELAAIADDDVCLQAPCRVCGQPSPYTQRMVPVDSVHMVGGLDDYEPRCKEHFTPHPSPPEVR